MTYEEVESQLGKPIAIERGANQLEIDYDKIPSDIAFKANFDTTIEMSPKRWFAPNSINKIGQLIYVTWVYDETKSDTFFMILDKYAEKEDTATKKVPVYYVRDRKVSYKEYTQSDEYEYRLADGWVTTEMNYYVHKNRGLMKDIPEPIKIKRIGYEPSEYVHTINVKAGIEKIYYLVSYKNCILFDASSGRVVEKGYFPYSVNTIN
jgi:hypothetical protein